MKTIKLELTPDEIQILVQALDTHVRQHGLKVAATAAMMLQKLQGAASANPEPESDREATRAADPATITTTE